MAGALWTSPAGLRVLKFDGAVAPRVVEGASRFIEGASLYKAFTTGLRPWENHTTALRALEMHPPLVAGALWTSPAGLRVDGPLGRRFLRGLSLTRLWREGCGGRLLIYRRRQFV